MQAGNVNWDEVFDESHEMPGRQTKYRHICDRTFLRPRDMIKFCNETLNAYKKSAERSEKFDNAEVIAARPAYSTYLLRELDDEIAKHVPLYKDHLEVLKRIGSVAVRDWSVSRGVGEADRPRGRGPGARTRADSSSSP